MANQQIQLNGFNMKIKDNGDGTYSSTNAKVVFETQLFSALAVTDNQPHDSSQADVSGISGRKYLHFVNTLNQAVTVSVIGCISDGTNSVTLGAKSFAASTSGIITAVDIPALLEPLQKIVVRVQCSTAPSSGNISVFLEGVSA